MGATSSQGWFLFIFLVGFTLGPAGLAGLGWPVAVLGFALLVAAFAGFRSIRQPDEQSDVIKASSAAPLLHTRSVKN